ncbi:peptidase S51 dipeptidase E, partial [Pseudomonas sp. BGM005]|nr:peptidase S51 dipeptidase E [Pseudomonas sp. BG5]
LIAETIARYEATHRLLPLRDDQALLVDGDRETVVDSAS